MKSYLRPAAFAVTLLAGIYALLLIAAAAAPAPTRTDRVSESSRVADHLKADAALLAHPGLRPRTEPQSP